MFNSNDKLTLINVLSEAVNQEFSISSKEKELAQQQLGTTKALIPNASLLFNGKFLQWIANGVPVKQWNATSGLTVLNARPDQWSNLLKRYTASPDVWAKDKNAGPTPPGNYVLGSLESRQGNQDTLSQFKALWLQVKDTITGKWNEKTQDFGADTPYSRISWGNFRSPVIPARGTNTFGRSGFYLHGGTLPGSHGCIDLAGEMDDFAKFYGTWLASTRKKSISLNINYGEDKNEVVQKVWQNTSNVPISNVAKTNVITQPATQSVSQPISEPIAKSISKPLLQPMVKQMTPTGKPVTQPITTQVYAKLGDRGDVVTNFQTKLQQLNYNLGLKGVDGRFGYDTQRALANFQVANGLKGTGILDQQTYNKLMTMTVQPPAKNEFM